MPSFFFEAIEKFKKKVYYKLLIRIFVIITLINNKNKVIYIAINMYI